MKLVLFIFVGLCFFSGSAHGAKPGDKLIKALITVESHGNDNAIGDLNRKHHAYGCLQIRKPVCDDVNRRYHTHYCAEQCLGNRELSIKICKLYIDMYATEKHLGHAPTNEDMTRIWNGGPNGWRCTSTRKYWKQVHAALED